MKSRRERGSGNMSDELIRFSVAMPSTLVEELDELTRRRGVHDNRSEVLRDLVREAIAQSKIESEPTSEVIGTLTIAYNHHKSDLSERLHDIQHDYCGSIVSTTHVHVDPHTCLEVIIIRGVNRVVRKISDKILGTRGVNLGRLVVTSTESV